MAIVCSLAPQYGVLQTFVSIGGSESRDSAGGGPAAGRRRAGGGASGEAAEGRATGLAHCAAPLANLCERAGSSSALPPAQAPPTHAGEQAPEPPASLRPGPAGWPEPASRGGWLAPAPWRAWAAPLACLGSARGGSGYRFRLGPAGSPNQARLDSIHGALCDALRTEAPAVPCRVHSRPTGPTVVRLAFLPPTHGPTRRRRMVIPQGPVPGRAGRGPHVSSLEGPQNGRTLALACQLDSSGA
jgi:hypothetical protein